MPAQDSPPPSTPLPTPDDAQRLFEMINGKIVSRCLGAVAEVGVADRLADGPKTVAELAKCTGTNEDALGRVLRALASVGAFVEAPDGRFALTALGATLRSDVKGSMRAMARMMNLERFSLHPWAAFDHALSTGKTSFGHVHGDGCFGYLARNPREAAVFDDAMTAFSGLAVQAVVDAWEPPATGLVVDVGGGHGTLISALLGRSPELRGMIYDLPHVVEGARKALAASSVFPRLEFRAGDFFASVPAGADLYVMKHIIHDWSDAHCTKLLGHCRAGLNPGGRVVVFEMVVPEGNDPHPSKFLDLEMLVMTDGGRERTEAAFRSLFRSAGLEVTRILPTQSPICVIEGRAR